MESDEISKYLITKMKLSARIIRKHLWSNEIYSQRVWDAQRRYRLCFLYQSERGNAWQPCCLTVSGVRWTATPCTRPVSQSVGGIYRSRELCRNRQQWPSRYLVLFS